MSTAIVLPTLTNWAKQHITAILQATNQQTFDNAFNAFLANNVSITVNGDKMTRDQYKKMMQGEKFDEAGASVSYAGAVEVPADPQSPVLAGTVGLFFNATVSEKILLLGAPQSSTINSCMNIVVSQDPTIEKPHLPGRGGFFDARRVSILNQVNVDNQNAVLIPLPNPGNPGGPIIPPSQSNN
ncbi:hypothetical protein ABKN59_009464 [Abortiporus biennis]